MSIGNALVSVLLRSPLHRVLSGSTDLIRYTGRRSGRVITTPTQYATHGDGVVILVGRPEAKQWWRNFSEARDLDVLVRGVWRPMRGRAIVGADEPGTARPLLETYLARFPRAARSVDGTSGDERIQGSVVVECRPR
ncbi:MAG: nitroreductase/quinone reductase family protein [Acidimicrobiia bacterium]